MIIGITGTLGAGKGTVVRYLKEKGFNHFSVRDYLIQEIKNRGMIVNRDSMVLVANDLREKNSPSFIVEELYEIAKQFGKDCVIESIRSPGEAALIKQKGGILISIDSDPRLRYSRILSRNSETDNVNFEEFLENEKREMISINPYQQNLSKCIELSDFKIENNKTIEELNKKIEEICQTISLRKIEKKLPNLKEENPIQKRPSWDEYFIKMAALVAERSTCLRHNIGAVIVRNKRVLTTGYNGAAKGMQDCLTLGCRKDELNIPSGIGSEECRAIHAEQNAIIQAALHGINIEGSTLYCTTIPCRMCAKEIVNAGIKEVITYSNYEGAKGSEEFLEKGGVSLKKISRPKNIISFKD